MKIEETTLGGQMRVEQRGPNAWAVLTSDGRTHAVLNTEAEALTIAENATSPEGGPIGVKFDQWQLPGGENYRELLLRLPEKKLSFEDYHQRVKGERLPPDANERYMAAARRDYESYLRGESDRHLAKGDRFTGGHYGEYPNVLAHVRYNERTDADGKRVLFLEEIQSDWGQKGKKEGFEIKQLALPRGWSIKETPSGFEVWGSPNAQAPIIEAQATRALAEEQARKYIARLGLEAVQANLKGGVPAAPFVGKTEAWVGLVLKRMVRMASEQGFDRLSWTTGDQQAERYDLSKQVEAVTAKKRADGQFFLISFKPLGGGQYTNAGAFLPEKLPDVVGKDLARRIADQTQDSMTYTGLDLKVGGRGMIEFYDKIVPNVANDLLKKLGGGRVDDTFIKVSNISDLAAKEEAVRLRAGGEQGKYTDVLKQPGFGITPELQASAMRGLPLFARSTGYSVIEEDGYIKVKRNGETIAAGTLGQDGRLKNIEFTEERHRKINTIRMPAMKALQQWEKNRAAKRERPKFSRAQAQT
ncbi:MAG: hypothetical protein ACREA9_06805, partial [Pyrinomonadaceae bacterium]